MCNAPEQLARVSSVCLINTGSTGYAKGRTPLIYVCEGAGKYGDARVRIAQLLIERQANLEARDQQGNTALLLAAAGGFTSMVELLKDRGADLLATNTHTNCSIGQTDQPMSFNTQHKNWVQTNHTGK